MSDKLFQSHSIFLIYWSLDLFSTFLARTNCTKVKGRYFLSFEIISSLIISVVPGRICACSNYIQKPNFQDIYMKHTIFSIFEGHYMKHVIFLLSRPFLVQPWGCPLKDRSLVKLWANTYISGPLHRKTDSAAKDNNYDWQKENIYKFEEIKL